ncbi:MAG: SDR family NAD(P)-dependent oxidoreductase [Reinekea sp.]|jgi:dihydromonapterin reductase / dihydrofolate reductase
MPHIVITGGSQRLGLALTEHFLAQSWQVSVLSRHSSNELSALACKHLTVYTTGDYSLHAIQPVCEQLQQDKVNVLVHNASLFEPDQADAIKSDNQLQQMMQVHVQLPAYLNRQLCQIMSQSSNANIIQMTDIYTINPNEHYANYCASKAAAANLALSLAKLLAPGIRVNCIAPGALKFLPSHSEQAKQAVLEGALIQHEAGFDPIIQSIDYLIHNSFITGTTLKVDGGRSLCR